MIRGPCVFFLIFLVAPMDVQQAVVVYDREW